VRKAAHDKVLFSSAAPALAVKPTAPARRGGKKHSRGLVQTLNCQAPDIIPRAFITTTKSRRRRILR
jgi:hypothetical protein